MKYLFLILFIFLLFFASCKKDDINDITNTTAEKAARNALYDIVKEWYLWNDSIPEINVSDYKDPYELLDAVIYKPIDRWSFVADYNAFVALYQGSFVGHGIRVGLDESDKARIVMIYKNSPLYSLGVRRGWIIKKLNDVDLAQVMISGDAEAYSNLFGPSTAGYTNKFLFTTPDSEDRLINSAKAAFQVNSVTMDTVFNLSSGKTGYLVFDEFITPSSQELAASFAYFKQQNVKDLILDLRYNSGGLHNVTTELASYISGLPASNIFLKSMHNKYKESLNEITYFKTVSSPLNLARLVVICTRETASASEEVINGLRPYIDVVCIGDTTYGKPTGMNTWSFDNRYIFAPVTLKLVNKDDFGDFWEGFSPAKYVPDDITHDFGDRNETCLSEAVHYMETGSVSTKAAYHYKRIIHYLERPKLMNNTFITTGSQEIIKIR